jgi:hypothetical protein
MNNQGNFQQYTGPKVFQITCTERDVPETSSTLGLLGLGTLGLLACRSLFNRSRKPIPLPDSP